MTSNKRLDFDGDPDRDTEPGILTEILPLRYGAIIPSLRNQLLLIIPAKEVMSSPAFACLLAELRKHYKIDFHKIRWKVAT